MRHDAQRHERCERQKLLVGAAIAALAKYGSGRVSVRLIAAEAQVSPGLITHHFGSIDTLFAAAAVHMRDHAIAALDQAIADAGDDPRDRLLAYVDASYRPPIMSAELLAAWRTMTGLSHSMPLVADAQRETIDRLVDYLCRLMTACAPDREHMVPAKALLVVIEGFWTEIARNADGVAAAEAVRVTRHWLRSLGPLRDETPGLANETRSHAGFAWGPR